MVEEGRVVNRPRPSPLGIFSPSPVQVLTWLFCAFMAGIALMAVVVGLAL